MIIVGKVSVNDIGVMTGLFVWVTFVIVVGAMRGMVAAMMTVTALGVMKVTPLAMDTVKAENVTRKRVFVVTLGQIDIGRR